MFRNGRGINGANGPGVRLMELVHAYRSQPTLLKTFISPVALLTRADVNAIDPSGLIPEPPHCIWPARRVDYEEAQKLLRPALTLWQPIRRMKLLRCRSKRYPSSRNRQIMVGLHDACRQGHLNVARLLTLLLKHGADGCAKATDGSTPGDHAGHKGHSEIGSLLVQNELRRAP